MLLKTFHFAPNQKNGSVSLEAHKQLGFQPIQQESTDIQAGGGLQTSLSWVKNYQPLVVLHIAALEARGSTSSQLGSDVKTRAWQGEGAEPVV